MEANLFESNEPYLSIHVRFPRYIKDLGNLSTAASALSKIDYLYRIRLTGLLDRRKPVFDSRKNPLRSAERSRLENLRINSPLDLTVEVGPYWLLVLGYLVLKDYKTIRENAGLMYTDFSRFANEVNGLTREELEAWEMGIQLYRERFEESAIEHGSSVLERIHDAQRFLVGDEIDGMEIDVDR